MESMRNEIVVPPKPRFDPTVNLGHVITFIGFILAGLGAYEGARVELKAIALRLEVVERQIEKLSEVIITTARQGERMAQLERRLEKLEERYKIIDR